MFSTLMMPFKLALSFTLFLFISSCSNNIVLPGMPTLDSHSLVNKNNIRPQENIDFKLIPISLSVISKLPKYQEKGSARIKKNNKPVGVGIGGYTYRVGPQDILNITVWDHPELTIPAGEFRSAISAGHKISADGQFFFPYAGRVLAAGKTTDQIRKILEKKLSKYITDPQVGVSVAAYRSQNSYISGYIKNPGVYPINDVPLTIRDIIAKAGGFVEKSADYALLVHNKQKIKIDLNALFERGDNSQNYVLRGGDSLYIAEKEPDEKVFVLGEVKDAGIVSLTRKFGLTLAEALSARGGITESTANPHGVFVVRQARPNDKTPSVYQLSITSVHSMLLAEQFSLRPRDIVYVTAAPITKWNRVLNQILPSLTVISASKAVTQ